MIDNLLKATVREMFVMLALKETVKDETVEGGEKEVPVVAISVSRPALVSRLAAVLQLMATLAAEELVEPAKPTAAPASAAPVEPAAPAA